MDIHNTYSPLLWQQDFHSANWKWACLCGGKGCVSANTKILTGRGWKYVEELTRPEVYWSWGKGKFQPSLGTASFPKGKENLYRVVHTHGEFVAASHHRVLDSLCTYRPVESFLVGEGLMGAGEEFAEGLLGTISDTSQKALLRDVLRLKKIVVGLMGNCLEYSRRYDPRLLLDLVGGPILSLKQAYVQGFDLGVSQVERGQKDVLLGQELKHNRCDQSLGHHSKKYSLDHRTALGVGVEGLTLSKSSEHIFRELQEHKLFLLNFLHRLKVQLSHHGLFDRISSLSKYSPIATILSIERLPYEEWYFDLQVRDTNSYIAGGAIHHNSGKSRAALEELIACALEFPGTTYLIGRKTLPSLMDSTWKEFLSVLPEGLITDYNKAFRNVKLINGSMFIGRPLDEPKKFDSLQISGFFLDEADELDEMVWKTLKDRVREMKTDAFGKKRVPRFRGIIGLNPTDEDHWIPRVFMDEMKPKDHRIFFSSAYDNLENLPPDYIDQLKQNYTEDMQQRMIYGLFGKVHKGRPVYPQFTRGNYIFPIDPKEGTVFRGWDFGYNHPACVWMQFIDGQLRVLGEKLGSKIYLEDFVPECQEYEQELFKLGQLAGNGFPIKHIFKDFCDPHGADETDKRSTSVSILNDFGIYPLYRRTTIKEGIKAVKELLDTKTGAGEPRFLIHGRCKNLVEGLRGGYHRLDGEEDPDKDGLYDHLQDCLRYSAVHLTRRYRFNKLQSQLDEAGVYINKHTGRRLER